MISISTVKFLNFRMPEKRCNLPKIQTKRPNLRVFRQKDADGIAKIEDPYQTARSSLIWVCTVCLDQSVPKLRIITVMFLSFLTDGSKKTLTQIRLIFWDCICLNRVYTACNSILEHLSTVRQICDKSNILGVQKFWTTILLQNDIFELFIIMQLFKCIYCLIIAVICMF